MITGGQSVGDWNQILEKAAGVVVMIIHVGALCIDASSLWKFIKLYNYLWIAKEQEEFLQVMDNASFQL